MKISEDEAKQIDKSIIDGVLQWEHEWERERDYVTKSSTRDTTIESLLIRGDCAIKNSELLDYEETHAQKYNGLLDAGRCYAMAKRLGANKKEIRNRMTSLEKIADSTYRNDPKEMGLLTKLLLPFTPPQTQFYLQFREHKYSMIKYYAQTYKK